ncbi:hypothetical protein O181_027582 [Austropuccinia psidii MF-1]|uniref:Uncharacterized protein n=1 Tax=Austropuccinia psidii MF-1 TaxID=1389203 RepID=A0A9Q3CQA4_9BASI|nr:hypothetical protein [Austropuccinia psidii MF-1]
MANWQYHQFYDQLAPFCVLWPLHHINFFWPLIAPGHILEPLASLPNSPPQQRPGQYPFYGAGGFIWPFRGLWHTPFDLGVYGHNGLFGPFRPPTASRAHSPWDLLCPFWAISNEAKRGQGVSKLSPKARLVPKNQWAHLSPFWPKIPRILNWSKGPQDPKLATINTGPHSQPMASGSHQGPPAEFQKGFLSIKGKTFPSFMVPITKDPGVVHIWYNIPLCTIFAQQSNGHGFRTQIFHYKSSLQAHSPLKRKTLKQFHLAIPDGYQKSIRGPQPLGSAEVGLLFHFRIIQREIETGYQSFNQL